MFRSLDRGAPAPAPRVGLLAPRPRKRSRGCAHAPLHPFASSGSSFLAQDKELKDFKELKELKESGAYHRSDSSRVQRPLPPLASLTPILLKLFKLLKLLILKCNGIRWDSVAAFAATRSQSRNPGTTCIVLRGGVSPPILPDAQDVAHARQEASAGEDLRSKATPAPSWLRAFVRAIPRSAWGPCPALFERGWLSPNADWAKCDVATTPAQARATPQSPFAKRGHFCITALRHFVGPSIVRDFPA